MHTPEEPLQTPATGPNEMPEIESSSTISNAAEPDFPMEPAPEEDPVIDAPEEIPVIPIPEELPVSTPEPEPASEPEVPSALLLKNWLISLKQLVLLKCF